MEKIKVAYFYPFNVINGGFGVLGKGFEREMEKSGLFDIVESSSRGIIKHERPDVIFTYGLPDLFDKVKEVRKRWRKKIPQAHYFVWESSILPYEWAEVFKGANLLLTATKYTKQCVKRQGLFPRVLHHAVDDRFINFKKLSTNTQKPFTFLHHNAYEYRKGWELCLMAFQEEFSKDENVKMIFKARERNNSVWLLPEFDDVIMTGQELRLYRTDKAEFLRQKRLKFDNFEEIMGHITDEEMIQMNSQADVFLFPAKGEGWGMPPVEAMGMGIVPIVPDVGSFHEWFNGECMLDCGIDGYLNSQPRYGGYMFAPSLNGLKKQMRWAFENQEEIKRMGEVGREYVKKNFNWDKIIRDLYYYLKQI